MPVSQPLYNEHDLVEGLRLGDSAVLSAIYKRHYNVVLKFILNNNGTEEAARDVYQEAVIVLYENARKPGFTLNCQVQTYLYSVSRRLWLNQLRRHGNTHLLREDGENELADVGTDMEAHLQKELDLEKMARSMEALGEPCVTLINDFYVHRRTMEEIAEKFGYTNAENAKNQKYKCLQRLKKVFFEKKNAKEAIES